MLIVPASKLYWVKHINWNNEANCATLMIARI